MISPMQQQQQSTEQVMDLIRKMPLFRQLIPQEAGIGWPIPNLKTLSDGTQKVYVTFLFFGMESKSADSPTILYPPLATMTLDWTTLVPVKYVSLRYSSPWPEGLGEKAVGTFPHAAILNLSVGEYKARQSELLALYDEMFLFLAKRQQFSDAWTSHFSTLLRQLLEPALEPYYRMLAPNFCQKFLG